MPRKHRLEFPGAIYHINHRGNHQEYIYRAENDRKLFLKLLKTTIERMNRVICDAFKLYAYTQPEIAAFLSLSRLAITKIICSTN